MKNRTLYFGDNLEILQKKIPNGVFDLIYLDPPFNSNRNYNVLFKEGLQDSPAQVQAFEDSWHWNRDSKAAFNYLVTQTNDDISNLMLALEKMVGHNDMLAYLAMMTVRLIELHRVLKNTGSLYLHCDPTASHYLKIVLDVVFGKKNFRNEIIWKRKTSSASDKSIARSHDTIFYYTKSDDFKFYQQYRKYSEEYVKSQYTHKDDNGIYRIHDVVANPALGGDSPRYSYKGYVPETRWLISKEKLEELDKQNRIIWSKSGKPYRKLYLDEMEGQPLNDIWTDISISLGEERLGYATQKPVALLERIISASSKEGDLILDPFCGCGTTIAAAEKLGRKWVGIDITTLAISLIKRRLKDQFDLGRNQIFVDGLPSDLTGAKELFKKDTFEFEYWVLDLINAMPAQSKSKENMRGADRGIDGVIKFIRDVSHNGNGKKNGNGNGNYELGRAIVQVKGGGVQRNQIATLKGDAEREKAEAGIFITMEEPTKPMIQEAIDAGSFTTPLTGKFEFPKIQILTVEELLKGKQPNLPQGLVQDYNKKAKPIEKNTKFWNNNIAVLF